MTNEDNLKHMAAQLRKPEGQDAIQTAEMMSKGNKRIIYNSLAALDATTGDHILEIGMGNGFHVKDILEKASNISYTGCDYAEEMVKESAKLNLDFVSEGRAKFLHADITSLPLEDARFSKALTINTIYFWDKEELALKELHRVLQPGGKLIIGFRPKRQTEKYPFTKFGFNQFSKEDVEKLLTGNGFSVVSIVENKEPAFEMNGITMETENVVVVAQKR